MFLQERFVHLEVYLRPLAGRKGRCKMEMCSCRNTRVLALPTPPGACQPSGETSRLFAKCSWRNTIDGFWLDQSTARGSRLVGLSWRRSLCGGAFSLGRWGGGEREVFLQEHFVVLRGSVDQAVYAKWRSVPEGTLWKTHIHGPGLVRINHSIVGDAVHYYPSK
jgi:hypothetical protein